MSSPENELSSKIVRNIWVRNFYPVFFYLLTTFIFGAWSDFMFRKGLYVFGFIVVILMLFTLLLTFVALKLGIECADEEVKEMNRKVSKLKKVIKSKAKK